MLDIDKIQKLIEVMVKNDLVEVSLRDGDVEVNLRRPQAAGCPTAPAVQEGVAPIAMEAKSRPDMAPVTADEKDKATLIEIKSPMVGTFYSSSGPDVPPFVNAGARVMPTTVVCLLEAMKVFSEIKAEVAGTIERILVKNAESVEYGQPLFLVRLT